MEPKKYQNYQQAFTPGANAWFRGGVLLAFLLLIGVVAAAMVSNRHQGYGVVGVTHQQPVLFSHRHHSGDLGIDCRYCHTSVEKSAFAGMPTTETCLSCHRGLFRTSPMLAPVWESLESGEPLVWNRVHDLKDVVFFNHQVHVIAGISCRDCHGDVESMIMVEQKQPMTMQWCLQCHRNPEKTVRPTDSAINVRRMADPRPAALTARLRQTQAGSTASPAPKNPHLEPFSTANLTDCSACHR